MVARIRTDPACPLSPDTVSSRASLGGVASTPRSLLHRDLLASYLRWTVKDGIPEEGQEEFEAAATFNVDKAFRRLEGYAVWMLDHKEMLDASPFSADHFRDG